MRIICFDRAADQVPARLDVLSRARELEVVDVDDKVQAKPGMPKARTPRSDGFEPHLKKVFLAMLLPVTAGIWAPVQCKS